MVANHCLIKFACIEGNSLIKSLFIFMNRKFITTMLALCLVFVSHAQEHKIEHNFNLGVGVASLAKYNVHYSLRIGYGLNYYLAENWSIMPGVSYRTVFDDPSKGDIDGIGSDDCSFIDVPVLLQYHQHARGEKGFVAELGPVFSFLTSNSTYYVDADPQDELNDKKMYKSFDFGIQPGVYYQTGKHWRFGVQAHIGFCNMLKKYPRINDSKRLNDVAATVNFSF